MWTPHKPASKDKKKKPQLNDRYPIEGFTGHRWSKGKRKAKSRPFVLPAVQRPPECVCSASHCTGGGKKVVSLKQGHPSNTGGARRLPAPRDRTLSRPQRNACHYAAARAGAAIGWREGKLSFKPTQSQNTKPGEFPKRSAAEPGSRAKPCPRKGDGQAGARGLSILQNKENKVGVGLFEPSRSLSYI